MCEGEAEDFIATSEGGGGIDYIMERAADGDATDYDLLIFVFKFRFRLPSQHQQAWDWDLCQQNFLHEDRKERGLPSSEFCKACKRVIEDSATTNEGASHENTTPSSSDLQQSSSLSSSEIHKPVRRLARYSPADLLALQNQASDVRNGILHWPVKYVDYHRTSQPKVAHGLGGHRSNNAMWKS